MSSETRPEIRRQLILARSSLLHWIHNISASRWEEIQPGSGETIGRALIMIAQRTDLLATMATGAANKHSFMNYPQGILRRVERLAIRIHSSRQTPSSIAERLSQSFQIALILLEDIPEDNWQNGVKILGRYRTVEQVYREYLDDLQQRMKDLGVL